jgi:uncharacterized protein (TIGR03083 family)
MYRRARERIIELVTAPSIDPTTIVPATPAWTVHDVVAHVAGVARDAVTGNMAGAPGDDWTAAQIARSVDASIAEMVAQWQVDGPMLDEVFRAAADGLPAAGVIDVHTHEADLRHALGLPFHLPADFLGWSAQRLRGGFVEASAAAGLPAVEVGASEAEWFRGRLGRRTVDEVVAYGWSADPTPYLDVWFIFGRAQQSLGERT